MLSESNKDPLLNELLTKKNYCLPEQSAAYGFTETDEEITEDSEEENSYAEYYSKTRAW